MLCVKAMSDLLSLQVADIQRRLVSQDFVSNANGCARCNSQDSPHPAAAPGPGVGQVLFV